MTTATTLTISDVLSATKAEAREYQVRVIQKAVDAFLGNRKAVLVNSPTGSGKSIMGLAAARRLQIEDPDAGVGWVAMRRNLLTQIAEMNENLQMGVRGLQPISMFNNNPPTVDREGRKIKLLVLDECHHQAVSSMMHLYDTIQPKWDLGLTATPFRTDRMRLTYQVVIRDISIQQLIEQSYLSPYHLFIIDAWTPETVAATYLREPQRWGQSVFFWHTRDQAEECVSLLRTGGMRTELVTAESDRERQLDAFEAGEVDCLVNMLILTEGFDCSQLRTVFVRDSQRGPTIQMAGRVFRRHPGVEYKNLVQSQHTHWPFSRTADPLYTYTWKDEQWRSHKLSPEIERVATRALMLMAQSDVKLPDFMLKKQMEGRRRGRHRREQGMNFGGAGQTEAGIRHGWNPERRGGTEARLD